MERKKFLQASFAMLSLGLIFPSLIRGKEQEKVTISCTKDSLYTNAGSLSKEDFVRRYPLCPDECWPPKKSIPEWISLTLTNIYSSIHMEIRAINPVTGKDDRVFGGAGMIVVEKTELPLSLLSEKLRPYQTVVLKYKYSEDDVYINLYIPVLRLLRDGEFRWNAARAIKNSAGSYSLMTVMDYDGIMCNIMEGPFDRPGSVIECWNDRIDIHLST